MGDDMSANLSKVQISVIRSILRGHNYSPCLVDNIMGKVDEWYPIWLEFKVIALRNFRANIRYGEKGYLGQMQILGEIRKMCPARGSEPYEVNNDWAPIFARLFNAIVHCDYFELRELKQRMAA